MRQKEVLLFLTERWADWEAAYAVAEINAVPQYAVKTIALDKDPKVSIGGVSAAIDYNMQSYTDFSNTAMLILPGGFWWQEHTGEPIAEFVRAARENQIPVAAICGATIFLGKHGFLDTVYHTGDELSYFVEHKSYHGCDYFKEAPVVKDNNWITANETGALEFAYEIFKYLKIDTEEEIAGWYQKFKYGMFTKK